MQKKKLIVIGIDGGTFNVIQQLFDKNLLPNLRKFKNYGILKSVVPPGTAVSWASFSTGNFPGKTGIYDFTIVNDDSWKINFVSRRRLKGKTLWEYLNESGLKSCFINIPLTYPPDKINGVMISGIDAPSTLSNYVYPKELKKELNKLNYEIEVSGLKDKSKVSEEAIRVLDKRIKITRELLEKDFDFFIVLFRASDVAQHYAWGSKHVEDIYIKIDKFIGEIQEYIEKNEKNKAEIIVMSDHGEEKVEKAFNINVWLEKERYLKTKLKKLKKTRLLSVLGINRERIFKILENLRLNFLIRVVPRSLGKKFPTKEVNFEEAVLTGLVDFSKTKAIGKRAVKTAQIFLNKKERGGIVEKTKEERLKKEIIGKLKIFFEKNKLKAEIKTKEELYVGKTKGAPDITLYFKEKSYDILDCFSSDKKLWDKPREQATHNTEGIIFSDMSLKMENAKIIDLSPTILDFFNIKKGEFDGRSML